MAFLKRALLVIVLVAAGSVCRAQQKFPLHSGDWEVSTSFAGSTKPFTVRVCLNDELWTKALSQNATCSIQSLSVWAKGVTYLMDCPSKTVEMKGKVELSFDGKEHMTGKATIDMTRDGKTTNSVTIVDYRWKGAICGPDDVNMKEPKPQSAPTK